MKWMFNSPMFNSPNIYIYDMVLLVLHVLTAPHKQMFEDKANSIPQEEEGMLTRQPRDLNEVKAGCQGQPIFKQNPMVTLRIIHSHPCFYPYYTYLHIIYDTTYHLWQPRKQQKQFITNSVAYVAFLSFSTTIHLCYTGSCPCSDMEVSKVIGVSLNHPNHQTILEPCVSVETT